MFRSFFGTLGRFALGAIGFLFLVQVLIRLLYRLVPTGIVVGLARTIDEPLRQRLLNPLVIARRVGARSGMRVLLIGPGDELPRELARIVEPDGRVEVAVLDPSELAGVRLDPRGGGLVNLAAVPGDGGQLPFPDECFAAICLVSTVGGATDRSALLDELWRVARPAGRLSLSQIISDPTYLTQATLVSLAEKAGFEWLESFGDVLAYTINLRKPVGPVATREADLA